MNRELLMLIILGEETGHIKEVAQLLERDRSGANVRKLTNDLKGEPRKCKRAVPVRSIRASTDEGRITGIAAPFNSPSVEMMGFVEFIRPGAFADSIRRGDDCIACYNHSDDWILGRTTSGTLRLEERYNGLYCEIDTPKTSWAGDVLELIKRGDISGMSFRFTLDEDRWTDVGGKMKRELLKVTLADVSPVTWPAYPATSVAARALIEKYCPGNTSRDPDILNKRLRLKEKTSGGHNVGDGELDRLRRIIKLKEKMNRY